MCKRDKSLSEFKMINYHLTFLKALSFINKSSSCSKIDMVNSCTKEIVLEICTNESLEVDMMDAIKNTNLEILE